MFSMYLPEAYEMALHEAQKSGYRYKVKFMVVDGIRVWVVGQYRRQQWRSP